jgi:TonB family protein
VTQVATVVSDAPAVEAAPAPVEAPQQVEQAIVQRPVEAVQHRVVQQRTVQGRPEAQADFGWLAQSIFSSVDPHKRYPAEAKRNRWKGRVILKLTVEQRGGAIHLLELVLKESSGHAALDRHTVDMVRTVFPLQVKHHIARAAIDVDIPITYQLAN